MFGLYLSCLMSLSVGFLEKWDQCVINALKGEFYCSMLPTPLLHDRALLLDTGPLGRLKVQFNIHFLLFFYSVYILIT